MKENFSFYKLAEREQKEAMAGQIVCLCGCAWANCGGSSSMDNAYVNGLTGLHSKEYTPQNAS